MHLTRKFYSLGRICCIHLTIYPLLEQGNQSGEESKSSVGPDEDHSLLFVIFRRSALLSGITEGRWGGGGWGGGGVGSCCNFRDWDFSVLLHVKIHKT